MFDVIYDYKNLGTIEGWLNKNPNSLYEKVLQNYEKLVWKAMLNTELLSTHRWY
jgi:hypothetical protein